MIKAEHDAVGRHRNPHGSAMWCLVDLTCEETVKMRPLQWLIAEASALEGEPTRSPMRRYRLWDACFLNELACVVIVEDP